MPQLLWLISVTACGPSGTSSGGEISWGLRGEMMPGQHLVFEGGEERLRGGVIETRPDPAHRLHNPEPGGPVS